KLWHNLGFQLQGEYESPRVIPQGRIKSMYGFDFAIRKDFLKNNAGTLVFNVQDVLNSRVRGSITDTENFYQDAFRRWNVRSFRLTFSYRFGNNQLQLFNKRREGGGEDHDGGDGGAR
ncbi:MAG TPA: outer membrane beta-barrel protein, partial [Phnomibacter sp.]|nr:outer membrane beta-barrel protein [Phnomibacter sp.]